MDNTVAVRTARPEDAPALCEIYAPYVESTAITFEYEVPGTEEFAGRIRETLRRYPYLVAERDGEILGYAYASPYHSRAAYQWGAETSIYVRQDLRHGGVGKLLYQALEEALARQGVKTLYACIACPNPASIGFHEKLGYQKAAHFRNSGFKLEKWWDIIWMEKALGDYPVPPRPFVPFSK